MKISIPKETKLKENRVALTPDVVKDLVKKGFEVQVESGAGVNSFFADDALQKPLIVGLHFFGVGKKEIHFFRYQHVDRHFLDAQ